MNEQDNFELLRKVGKADVPPFLLTRIHAQIRALGTEPAPLSWRWAASLATCLLIFTNIYFIRLDNPAPQNDTEVLVGNMQLNQSNQLYHE